MNDALNPRQRKMQRKAALWTERSSWDSHWRELAKFMQPRLSRFHTTEVNQGGKRHNNIYDPGGIFALRTLAAGMMSGMTSPARPWFRLTLQDKELLEYGPVRDWLFRVADLMRSVFASSNTYNALHQCYRELGLFGTWADFVEPDFDAVLHHYPMTAGEYAIATDAKGRVNTLVRETKMTVGAIVDEFGIEQVSPSIKNLYDRHHVDAWVDIVHIVEPRRMADRDARLRDAKNMPFSSCYFEPGNDAWDKYLRESGYRDFPALCPRWDVTSNDIYGSSPGMDALGHVKQLQQEQLRKAQAIDYQANPPLQVPAALKDKAHSRLPGGVSYYDQMSPGGGIRTAFDVNLRLDYLLADIQDVREGIRSAFYADLFLMLASQPANGKMTATEVAERHEEKLLMLGPVLERLHNELLSPLIDTTFDRLVRAGVPLVVNPPPELQGMDLNIEFVSTLAQAQRAVAAAGTDRLLGTVTSLAALWPEVTKKIDPLQIVDDYADLFGVNPKIIVPDDVVQERIAAEQQAAQAAQAAAAAPVMAETAKTASEINTENLTDILGQFQGYNSPSPLEVAAQ